MAPQDAAGAVDAGALPCGADILAGKAAADETGQRQHVGAQALGGKFTDVLVAGNAGPVAVEHGAGKGVYLAKRDGMISTAFQTERETADAAEKVKNVQLGIAGSKN